MRRQQARRIQALRPTVFAEMSDLSSRFGAVNLGQGFPDFEGPSFVKEAAISAISANANQYAHPSGVRRLRLAIAENWRTRTAIEVNPDTEVSVTSGATEAIFDIVMALVDADDEVIVFEPFYDSYPASVTMAGGVTRTVALTPPDWTFTVDHLREAISNRTRVILLNTPHNPTGRVFTVEELREIAEIAQRHDLIVVTDEVYDRIVFDDAVHVSIATLPGMWERTLTINSTGKTFSLTGWKIGYAVGPPSLIASLRSVHQFVTFATATPFQEAMADALEMAATNGYYDRLRAEYHLRRDRLREYLERAGLPALPVQGSYFLMTPFDHLPFDRDVDLCRWLIETIGVTPIPPSAFYAQPDQAPKVVRFCFAKQLATLDEAGKRLATLSARILAH